MTMTELIEQLTNSAKKVRLKNGAEYGIVAAAVDVTLIRNDVLVAYRIYNRGEAFRSSSLDVAVAEAIAFDTKAEKLRKAAELRKQAEVLEKEAV